MLAMGVFDGSIELEDVKFDGVAGAKFDSAVNPANIATVIQRNDCIGIALKLDVPVEGLVANGVFGEKWEQVVVLCKQDYKPSIVPEGEWAHVQAGSNPDSSEPPVQEVA
jgi:hypothetical protein